MKRAIRRFQAERTWAWFQCKYRSAEGWEELLVLEIERQHAIRLPANASLERDIAELLTRPVGRPGYKPVVRNCFEHRQLPG